MSEAAGARRRPFAETQRRSLELQRAAAAEVSLAATLFVLPTRVVHVPHACATRMHLVRQGAADRRVARTGRASR